MSASPAPRRSANLQIARAAGTVMVSFVFSNLLGLLAKSLIASAFGAQGETDAFFAANRFSETLFNLVAGGALASAFIPTFTGLLTRSDRPGAWRLASAIANLVLAVLFVLCVLGAVFAPWVVAHLLASGFSDPAQQALTVALLRIQLPSAAIFAISGLCMGILNAHQRFLLPALAPSMYSLGLIAGATLLARPFGIYGLAWGVVLGSALHLLVQLPTLLRLPEIRFTPSLGLNEASTREVLRLMGPRLLGVAVVQLNFWINTLIASSLAEGSLAGINLAFPLMLMPQAAIAQSIAIAALPTFSAQVASGKLAEMRNSLAATLRGVLLLALPATVGLVLLRTPLVALLYQRGEFTAESTALVAWALLWYALGLVGHSVVEITSRAFYALHDTKTPVAVGVATMSLNAGFSLLFSWLFQRVGWAPHGGLALANSLATFLEMFGLIYLMRRRLRGIEGGRVLRAVLSGGAAAAGMGGGVWLWLWMTAGLPNWVIILGGVMLGGGLYGLLALLLQVDEARQVLRYGLTLPARLLRRQK